MVEAEISLDAESPPALVSNEGEDKNRVAPSLDIVPLIALSLQTSLPSVEDDFIECHELSPNTNITEFVSSTSCLLIIDNYIKISFKLAPIISVPITSETLNEVFVEHQNSELQSSTYDIYNN